jgi:hypothetical protein
MVAAAEHLLIAGPKGRPVVSEAAYRGQQGVAVQVLGKADGRVVQELPLEDLPVFDGLAASGGGVFVALHGGRVVCLRTE